MRTSIILVLAAIGLSAFADKTASQEWVLRQNYVTKTVTNGLATTAYVDEHTPGNYETVSNKAMTALQEHQDISGKQDRLPYPTNAIPYSAVNGTPDISDMATKTWVSEKNYVTETVTNGLATKTYVDAHAPGDYENVSNKAVTALHTSDIENSVTSTSTDKALSANMGKELQDAILNLQQRGRYLSVWDCSSGKALTSPVVLPYDYKSGDYFIVGVVTNTTNYRPFGDQYTEDPAHAPETQEVKVNDTYYFDGTMWSLLASEQKAVTFGSITGNIDDNDALHSAFESTNDLLRSYSGAAGVTAGWGSDGLTFYDINHGERLGVNIRKAYSSTDLGTVIAHAHASDWSWIVIPGYTTLQYYLDNKFSEKANVSTTLEGYGIVDAYTKTDVESISITNGGAKAYADTTFLPLTGTAVNSDKLGSHDLSYFATASALSGYLPLSGGAITGDITFMDLAGVYFKDSGVIYGAGADNIVFGSFSGHLYSYLEIDGSDILTQDKGDGRYLRSFTENDPIAIPYVTSISNKLETAISESALALSTATSEVYRAAKKYTDDSVVAAIGMMPEMVTNTSDFVSKRNIPFKIQTVSTATSTLSDHVFYNYNITGPITINFIPAQASNSTVRRSVAVYFTCSMDTPPQVIWSKDIAHTWLLPEQMEGETVAPIKGDKIIYFDEIAPNKWMVQPVELNAMQ